MLRAYQIMPDDYMAITLGCLIKQEKTDTWNVTAV